LYLEANRLGGRQCVAIMRYRGSQSFPFVVCVEDDAVPMVRDIVGNLAAVHAVDGTGSDDLHSICDVGRVN
jgi:hypothetical protein